MRPLFSFVALLVACAAVSVRAGEDSAPPVTALAAGRTLHVVAGGPGDTPGDGSEERPWRSLDEVEKANLRPGDVVRVAGVHRPDYGFRLTGVHGTDAAWVRVVGEPGAAIVATGEWNAVEFVGCSFVALEDFEITSTDRELPFEEWRGLDGVKFRDEESHDVAVLRCFIHGLGGVGVQSQAPLVSRLRIERCLIEMCFTGVYLGTYEHGEKHIVDDSVIRGNVIRLCPPIDLDGRGYGIQLKGGSAGNAIEDNVLSDTGGGDRAAIAVYHASSQARPVAEPNVVRRNLVLRARHEGIYAAEGAVIENNLIVDSGAVGIECGPRETGGWGRFHGDLTIRHNTVVRVGFVTGRAIRLVDGDWTGRYVVAGNVAAVEGRDQVAIRSPARFKGTASGNICLGRVSGDGLGELAVTRTGFVSLAFGEPGFAIPSGVGPVDPAFAPDEDFEGRPRDRRPLPGCFEGAPSWSPAEDWKPLTD